MLTIRSHILAILLLCAYPLPGQSVRLSLALDRDVYVTGFQNNLYLQATVDVEGDPNTMPPRNDIVFLVDRSGSMEGEKLEQTKFALRQALTQLSSHDTVTVIAFGSSVDILIPPTPVDQISSHYAAIENLKSEGGSALYEGIATALDSIHSDNRDKKVSRILLITDGPPNKGPRDAASFTSLFSLAGQSPPEFTSLYIGDGSSEQDIQSLSTLLPSPPIVVENPEKLSQIIIDSILAEHPLAGTDAVLEISFETGIEIEESIGREAEITRRKIRFHLGALQANREMSAITQATMSGTLSIFSRAKIASATLTYNSPQKSHESSIVIKEEIYTGFSSSPNVSFDSIRTNIFQAVCEGEVSDLLKESNQWVQEGEDNKALKELKKLSREIHSIAIDLPELQIDELINQLNLAIQQIEITRDSSIEKAARDKILYPSATSQNNE